jgi:CheY-like chemotaxis protein
MVQILLAESDRPIRQFMAGILTDFGHDVTVCQDGAEAAALLAIGPIDVLITDLVVTGSTPLMRANFSNTYPSGPLWKLPSG